MMRTCKHAGATTWGTNQLTVDRQSALDSNDCLLQVLESGFNAMSLGFGTDANMHAGATTWGTNQLTVDRQSALDSNDCLLQVLESGFNAMSLGFGTDANMHAGATTWGTNQLTVDRRSLEAAGRVRPAAGAADARVLFSCGTPMAGVSLQIVHPDSRAPAEDGTVGEIWLSSPCVTAGYFNKPDLNAQVFQVCAPASLSCLCISLGFRFIF